MTLRSALFALLMTASAAVCAEQKVVSGDWAVHWTLINSADLLPQVARAYGIRRSRNRGLVILNPMRRDAGGETAVAGTASGVARNLIGHRQTLSWRAIDEGQAYYLIAGFDILNQEFLHFDIEVLPEGATEPLRLKLTQQFFTD